MSINCYYTPVKSKNIPLTSMCIDNESPVMKIEDDSDNIDHLTLKTMRDRFRFD